MTSVTRPSRPVRGALPRFHHRYQSSPVIPRPGMLLLPERERDVLSRLRYTSQSPRLPRFCALGAGDAPSKMSEHNGINAVTSLYILQQKVQSARKYSSVLLLFLHRSRSFPPDHTPPLPDAHKVKQLPATRIFSFHCLTKLHLSSSQKQHQWLHQGAPTYLICIKTPVCMH